MSEYNSNPFVASLPASDESQIETLPVHQRSVHEPCLAGNGENLASRLGVRLQPTSGDWFRDMAIEDAPEKVAEWLSVLIDKDQVVELRVLGYADGAYRRPAIMSGFFDGDTLRDMAHDALDLTAKAKGVYLTLNPVNPDLLARRYNRVDYAGDSGDLACDGDVLRRRWLLVDADPVRISGVSSTDAEKAMAKDVILQVRGCLGGCGWPEPILADSGNGYHLLYRIDLPAEDDGLVKQVLVALAQRFDNDAAKIDRQVFNPGRIVKLYGTLVRKGDDVPDRPHRWSGMLEVPADLLVVRKELLEELASQVPLQQSASFATRGAVSVRRPPSHAEHESTIRRARHYLAKVEPAISGQGGHNRTYKAACRVMELFDLSVDEALPLLREWNETCQPPWTERELRHKLEDAAKNGSNGRMLRLDHGNGDDVQADSIDVSGDEVMSQQVKAADDPTRLARLFLDRHHRRNGRWTLRYWQGQWCRWKTGAYQPLAETDLRAKLWSFLEAEFDRLNREKSRQAASQGRRARGSPRRLKPSMSLVNNVLGALGGVTLIEGHVEQPAWLGDEQPYSAGEMLVAKNGMLHLPSWTPESGKSELLPLTPDLFNSVALEYDFDPEAPAPVEWYRFLEQLFPGDSQAIETLQEWFGYNLLPDTSLQKILFLLGPPRAGKGIICKVLTELIGRYNVAGPTLASLASQFGIAPLLGKPLAIISDARISGRSDPAIVVERLLSVSGEDRLDIDRKNREPVTVKLPTRLMLASNELPRLADSSTALPSRMIVLRLTHSWLGKEDPRLQARLLNELPGILNWAIRGLLRLRQRGHFVQPDSGKQARGEMTDLASPVKQFLDETCRLGAGLSIPCDKLYDVWRSWAEANGEKNVNTKAFFGRQLRAAAPTVERKQTRSGVRRMWVYDGVDLDLGKYVAGDYGNQS